MGMVMTARTVTPEQLALLQDGGYLDDEPELDVDVDKAWHGIHWLLTGSGDDQPPTPRRRGLFRRRAAGPTPSGPESLAVLGGEPVGADNGYGPARYLRPDEVAAVAAALQPLTPELLADRLDLASMDAEGLYPQIWDEEDVYEAYLSPIYAALRQFYLDAAARGAAVLLAID